MEEKILLEVTDEDRKKMRKSRQYPFYHHKIFRTIPILLQKLISSSSSSTSLYNVEGEYQRNLWELTGLGAKLNVGGWGRGYKKFF